MDKPKKNQQSTTPSQQHCEEWVRRTGGQTMCFKHKPTKGTPPNAFKNCFNCRFCPSVDNSHSPPPSTY